MTTETLIALFGLAAAASWTPGPNNLMLAASGVNFGFRRTVPHMAGISLGFPLMFLAVGLGLGQVFEASPALREVMRWGGAALLLWFAWRIATAGGPGSAGGAPARTRPLTFLEAAGFQWINPKAWAMSLAATSQFVTGENALRDSALCALAFFLVAVGSSAAWSGFGLGLRRFLSDRVRRRIFNITMGALVASFVIFLFSDRI